MSRSKLLFSFSLINFVAVLICVLLMPSQVVIKFNSDMIVTDLFSRWFSIIIPTLQVVSCFVILFIDQKEQWKVPHHYRYIVAYIAISLATLYSWIMITIQFGGYNVGDEIKLPLTCLILIPLALFMLVYTYYQGYRKYQNKSIFGFSWTKNSPMAWKKTHFNASVNGMICAILMICTAVINDVRFNGSAWAYVVALGLFVVVYYFFTLVYSYIISKDYR